MASLRFSHVLLIIALSSWFLALSAPLLLRPLLYTLSASPLFLGTLTSIFEIPAHYLVALLPEDRPDYLSMTCFLLAIACAFIAGSVYGMEREAENLSSYLSLSDFEAENVVNLSSNHTDYFYDIEKGDLPPYSENDSCTDSPYLDEKTRYTPYTDAPSSAAGKGEGEPAGDAMTGIYYPSRTSIENTHSQALAQRELIAANRSADALINATHLSNITISNTQNGSGDRTTTQTHNYPGASAGGSLMVPATPRLTPSIPTRSNEHAMVATSYDHVHAAGGRYTSASLEDFENVELFSIYETEGACGGGEYDFVDDFVFRL